MIEAANAIIICAAKAVVPASMALMYTAMDNTRTILVPLLMFARAAQAKAYTGINFTCGTSGACVATANAAIARYMEFIADTLITEVLILNRHSIYEECAWP